jgi:hypothetical protein
MSCRHRQCISAISGELASSPNLPSPYKNAERSAVESFTFVVLIYTPKQSYTLSVLSSDRRSLPGGFFSKIIREDLPLLRQAAVELRLVACNLPTKGIEQGILSSSQSTKFLTPAIAGIGETVVASALNQQRQPSTEHPGELTHRWSSSFRFIDAHS